MKGAILVSAAAAAIVTFIAASASMASDGPSAGLVTNSVGVFAGSSVLSRGQFLASLGLAAGAALLVGVLGGLIFVSLFWQMLLSGKSLGAAEAAPAVALLFAMNCAFLFGATKLRRAP